MLRIFVLEDMWIRIQWFKHKFKDCELKICTNADDAISILTNDRDWDYMFLDHDLGNRIFIPITDENSGSRVAKFLSQFDIKSKIIIHSCNGEGAKNMLSYLPSAEHIMFGSFT